MVLLDRLGVAKAVLVARQLVEAVQDVSLRLKTGGRALHTETTMVGFREDLFRERPHFVQNPARLESVDGVDHARLESLAPFLELNQQPGNAGIAGLLGQIVEHAAKKLDLDVEVPGVTEVLGNSADGFVPPLDLPGRETVAEHPERGAKPARGNPRLMDTFDILGHPSTLELAAESPDLLANVAGGE